jgi:hypothetical protein
VIALAVLVEGRHIGAAQHWIQAAELAQQYLAGQVGGDLDALEHRQPGHRTALIARSSRQ